MVVSGRCSPYRQWQLPPTFLPFSGFNRHTETCRSNRNTHFVECPSPSHSSAALLNGIDVADEQQYTEALSR